MKKSLMVEMNEKYPEKSQAAPEDEVRVDALVSCKVCSWKKIDSFKWQNGWSVNCTGCGEYLLAENQKEAEGKWNKQNS